MSEPLGPTPGNYYIVNASGVESLAITFNGLYTSMDVTELQDPELSTQVWALSTEENGLQGISPLNGRGLYIVPGNDHDLMASASPGGFVWSIRGNEGVYTIRTEDEQRVWDIKEVNVGQAVVWQSGADAQNQYWNLVPARTT